MFLFAQMLEESTKKNEKLKGKFVMQSKAALVRASSVGPQSLEVELENASKEEVC